jgi:outer membrane protein OmpA-like peptidoglycan-associated protein
MNTQSHRTWQPRLALLGLGVALLAACSSMPAHNLALDQARSRLEVAESQPQNMALAGDEMGRAREALRRADRALANGDSVAEVDHLAYLAQQQVAIAEDTAGSRAAQAVTANAAAERDHMRLALRTREADEAQSQRSAAESASALKSVQLAQSEADAQAQRERLARRDATVSDLQSQLKELNARQTERGIVVTLGDVLFDTGISRLRPEGLHSIDVLAGFMKRNPERHASVEGHTDSVGSAASNQALSDRRAQSVLSALVQRGVPGDQLSAQAFGEEHPVAGNDTAAGRQQNRRVEIVFDRQPGDLVLK